MRKHSLLIIISISIILSCSGPGVEHRAVPPESVRMEILKGERGLLRSLYCDLYADEVTTAEWNRIFEAESFRKEIEHTDVHEPRIPPLNVFRIMVRNTWKLPLRIVDISVAYGDKQVPCLDSVSIAPYIKSPLYSPVNWETLFAPRRLAIPPETEIINYDTDTVRSLLDFIPADDVVMRIVAFPWIPVEARDFILKVTVTDGSDKKIIDFEFHRFEYRTSGKYYLKPARKDDHEN